MAGGTALVVLGVAGLLALRAALEGAFVSVRLQRLLEGAIGSGYTLSVERVTADPLPGSLRLEGVRVEGGSSAAPEHGAVAEIDVIELRGVDWLSLAVRGAVRANEIRVERPSVRLVSDGRSARRQVGPREPLSLGLARALPRMRIGTLRVREGRACLAPGPSPACPPAIEDDPAVPGALRAAGIEATLRDVRVDRAAALDPARTLFASRLEAALDSLHRGSEDGLTRLATGPVRVSTDGAEPGHASLVAEGLRWEPSVPDAEFFRRLTHRRDRVRLAAARCSVRALDVGRWLRTGTVAAAAVTLDSLEVDVRSDKNLPPRRASDRFPLPIPRIGRSLLVDTVRLDGRARYAEVPAGRSRPGRISVERLSVAARRVTTDPTLVSREAPTEVRARGRLFGAVPTEIRLAVFQLAPSLGMEFEGGAGPAALQAANAALVPLRGLRIDGGRMDTLWFGGRVGGGAASGSLVAVYRDLHVSLRDPETGGSGLVKTVKSLLADWKVRSENLPGEELPLRSGEIAHPVERQDALFQVIWAALRSGIRDLVR